MRLSRRGFVRTVVGESLVVGFDVASRSWVAAADQAARAPFDRVPRLDGSLLLDEATRNTYAQDYGQVVHEHPSAVLRPGSVEDIGRIVGFARRARIPIVARGQGHQPFGQAQVTGGVVVDMRSLRAVRAVSAESIEAEAGADWRTVLQAALSRGATPPVLTAYLGLTVGGTLSIGGVGVTTWRHGAQVDHVRELHVVTGEGRELACSEARNRDLFEAALAGQGQCAIITRAVLDLVRAPSTAREYTLPYADTAGVLRDGARLTEDGRFDGVVGVIGPSEGRWAHALSASRRFSPPDAPDDAALTADLGHVPSGVRPRDVPYRQHADPIPNVEFGPSRPDLGLCVPGSKAAAFIDATLPRLTAEDLGAAVGLRVFFWRRAAFTRPLFRLPDEATCVYVAILRAPTTDPAAVARMLAGNRALVEQNRALGGVIYPFSAVQMSGPEWEQHYGAAWPALVRTKRRHDPDRVLASGPDLFRGATAR